MYPKSRGLFYFVFLKLTKLFFKQSNKLSHYGLSTVRTTSWLVSDRWWAAESTAKVGCLTGGGLKNICWNLQATYELQWCRKDFDMTCREIMKWGIFWLYTHLRGTAFSLHVLESFWNETDGLNKDKNIKNSVLFMWAVAHRIIVTFSVNLHTFLAIPSCQCNLITMNYIGAIVLVFFNAFFI